jgi:enolase-like protein
MVDWRSEVAQELFAERLHFEALSLDPFHATVASRYPQVAAPVLAAAERLERGIAVDVANSVLVKPNQNGTVSGTKEVVDRAREAGLATVLSARSGDTEDS